MRYAKTHRIAFYPAPAARPISVKELRHAFVEAYLAALPETYDKEPWREVAVATFAGMMAVEAIRRDGPSGPVVAPSGSLP